MIFLAARWPARRPVVVSGHAHPRAARSGWKIDAKNNARRPSSQRNRESYGVQNSLVILVPSDPEPNHFIACDNAERAIIAADPHRVDWVARANALEAQPAMTRILPKTMIRFARLPSHLG